MKIEIGAVTDKKNQSKCLNSNSINLFLFIISNNNQLINYFNLTEHFCLKFNLK